MKWSLSQEIVEQALLKAPKTTRQLIDETGYTYPTVKRALDRIEERGQLKRTATRPVRFSLLSVDGEESLSLVEPLRIPMLEVGPRWQAGSEKLGKEIMKLDLRVSSLGKSIKILEAEAASILGVLAVLRALEDGPDWREQIGLPA